MLPTEAWVFLAIAALLWAAYWAYNRRPPTERVTLCPTCRHHATLDDTGQCGHTDNHSGFGPADECACTDPYHQHLAHQGYGVP